MLLFLSGSMKSQSNESIREVNQMMEQYRFAEAEKLAGALLQSDSSNVVMLLLRGRALSSCFRYAEAKAVLIRAIRLDSVNIAVWYNLAGIYRQLGNNDLAVYACRKLIGLEPSNRIFILQLSNYYYNDGEYEKAKNVLLPLYRSDTTELYILKQLGHCYAELKVTDSAIFFYTRVLGLYPSDGLVTGKLANLYIRKKEFQQGVDLTEQYISHDSSNSGILQLNGFCRYMLKDYLMAESRFLQSQRLGDETKFTGKYLGLCYYKRELYDKAEPHFRKAFFADTTDAEVCFYYGVSAYRSMLPDTGIVYLNRTLKLLLPPEKFLSTLYAELAGAYNYMGRSDTALAILLKAREENQGNSQFLFRIAYQYDFHLNQPKKALLYYQEFLASTGVTAVEKPHSTVGNQPAGGARDSTMTNVAGTDNPGGGEVPADGITSSRHYSNLDFATRRVSELTNKANGPLRKEGPDFRPDEKRTTNKP